MAKRRQDGGTEVSLFPFLSILACIIGCLTMIIVALTVIQMNSGEREPEDGADAGDEPLAAAFEAANLEQVAAESDSEQQRRREAEEGMFRNKGCDQEDRLQDGRNREGKGAGRENHGEGLAVAEFAEIRLVKEGQEHGDMEDTLEKDVIRDEGELLVEIHERDHDHRREAAHRPERP